MSSVAFGRTPAAQRARGYVKHLDPKLTRVSCCLKQKGQCKGALAVAPGVTSQRGQTSPLHGMKASKRSPTALHCACICAMNRSWFYRNVLTLSRLAKRQTCMQQSSASMFLRLGESQANVDLDETNNNEIVMQLHAVVVSLWYPSENAL